MVKQNTRKNGSFTSGAYVFDRPDGNTVQVRIHLPTLLKGTLSTGRSGGYGSVELEHGGRSVRIQINGFEFQPKQRAAAGKL